MWVVGKHVGGHNWEDTISSEWARCANCGIHAKKQSDGKIAISKAHAKSTIAHCMGIAANREKYWYRCSFKVVLKERYKGIQPGKPLQAITAPEGALDNNMGVYVRRGKKPVYLPGHLIKIVKSL